MSLQYTMDNPAFFPGDDDRLIEEELQALENAGNNDKRKTETSPRTKNKLIKDIEIVDLFLAEEEEERNEKKGTKTKGTRKRAEKQKEKEEEQTRNEAVDSGMGSLPSRNEEEDENIENAGNNTKDSMSGWVAGKYEGPVTDGIKPLNNSINDTVLNINDYDAEDEDDINTNKNTKLKVRTVNVLPAHNEEAAILSTILVGMSIEAQYPPQLYGKIFRSYRMAKILGRMSCEEKKLILQMVEDF